MQFSIASSKEELRELYPLIEEGVEAINQEAKVPSPRIAADVYMGIMTGQLLFVVIHDDQQVWGWATIYLNTTMYVPTGVCDDLYLMPGAPKSTVDEFADFWEKHSLAEGAKRMMFMTAREGWGRRLASHDYQLAGYVYTKEA